MVILKLIFLFVAIWFSLINSSKVCVRTSIPGINFFLQALGIFGFIVLQFNLYQ